jgi:hypothetical protein
MRRLRQAAVALAVLAAVLLAAASFSFSGGRTFELVDERAAPIDPAYVAYSYFGSIVNPVDSITYRAKPLARGRVIVPAAFHTRSPLPIGTGPSLHVRLVYVPRLHNAWGNLNEQASSQPGIFTIETPGKRAIVSDLTAKPEPWAGTLSNLSALINELIAPVIDGRVLVSTDPVTVSLTRELIAHFRQEYEAFLASYGDVPRPAPEMPASLRWSTADEQRRWQESADLSLAREPRWGVMVERLYARALRNFEEWEKRR